MYNKILRELESIENIGLVKYEAGLTEKTSIDIKIKPENYTKWDYFIYKLNNKNKEKKGRPIVIKKHYPDVAFLLEGDISLNIFYECLCKKYYLIERPPYEHITIILKLTNNCNLNCAYCYDMPFRKKLGHNGVLSIEAIEHLIDIAASSVEKLHIIWHGGEPTLAGIDYYEKLYETVFKKYPYLEIITTMQTNGTLLNAEWFRFARENDMELGLSNNFLDEQTRTLPQGENGNNIIFEKIKLSKITNYGRKLGAIEVVTKDNIGKIIDIYEGYKEREYPVAFNLVFPAGSATENDIIPEYSNEYFKMIEKYFKHWIFDKKAIPDRFAETYFASILGEKSSLCSHGDCRYTFIGVNSNGDIYPCDRPLPVKYRIGNIFDFNSFTEIYASKAHRLYSSEIQYNIDNHCKGCPIEKLCGHDCPHKKYDATGNFKDKNPQLCANTRKIYAIAYKLLCDVENIDEINPLLRELLQRHNSFLPNELWDVYRNTEIEPQIKSFDGDIFSDEFALLLLTNYAQETIAYPVKNNSCCRDNLSLSARYDNIDKILYKIADRAKHQTSLNLIEAKRRYEWTR